MTTRIDYGRVRELYDAGCNDWEVGRQLGCHWSLIRQWRLSHGFPAVLRSEKSLAARARALRGRYENGEIAKRLGCGEAYIRAVFQRADGKRYHKYDPARDRRYRDKFLADIGRI